MRWSQTLIPTQKQDPTDAVIASHKLLVRAGFIRQLQAGCYTMLPLAQRVLQKIQAIIREEMNASGAVEMLMPALQPGELWERSGRFETYGENLMKLTDRHGRASVLGPTHEEVVTTVVGESIQSYKQLPINVYQIQTKFRDEFRPRFGMLRVREFLMKDAYSFAGDWETLDQQYDEMYAAYERIFERCGVPVDIVEADSGPIGGSASHEFMAPCAVGEDLIFRSDQGNYAANVEKCEIGERDWTLDGEPTGGLEEVHTPGMATIEDVGKFMKVKPRNMLKTLVYRAEHRGGGAMPDHLPKLVLAVVRGDHQVNEAVLSSLLLHDLDPTRQTVQEVVLTPLEQASETLPLGFVGPDVVLHQPEPVALYIERDAAAGGFWAAGGNKPDRHVKHFNWKRDLLDHGFTAIDSDKLASDVLYTNDASDAPISVLVGSFRNAVEGDPSPSNDDGMLQPSRGIELGHVFKLGTKYSDSLDAKFLGEDGQRHPFIMGCYGIGVGRILLAAVEQFHDERGIIWPGAIAPFCVVITPIRNEGEMAEVAERLYMDLTAAGIDVLLDDRDERPGPKFADADLIGIPLRITVGDRGLKEGKLEFKRRGEAEPAMVPVDEAVHAAVDLLHPDTLPSATLSA